VLLTGGETLFYDQQNRQRRARPDLRHQREREERFRFVVVKPLVEVFHRSRITVKSAHVPTRSLSEQPAAD